MESPSLEILKTWLDEVLSNLLSLTQLSAARFDCMISRGSFPSQLSFHSAKCFGQCFFANAVRGILNSLCLFYYVFLYLLDFCGHPGILHSYIYSGEFSNPLYPQVPFDGLFLWLWYSLLRPWNICVLVWLKISSFPSYTTKNAVN